MYTILMKTCTLLYTYAFHWTCTYINIFTIFYIAHHVPAVVATAATESLLGATEGVSCRVRGQNDEITNIIYWAIATRHYTRATS